MNGGSDMENKIKDILKEKNIKIIELARITGLHYGQVHDIVNKQDLQYTQLKTLRKIAEALDVKVSDLYEIEGGKRDAKQ